MKVNDIIRHLETLAPPEYAMDWDNPGLLAGRRDRDVSCVYVALDATPQVIRETIRCGAQMLVTHHPMIFSPLKKVNDEDFVSWRVLDLVENHISYFAMHTNFDVAQMGTLAAGRLMLTDLEVLEVTAAPGAFNNSEPLGIGCVGRYPRHVTLGEYARIVKTAFGLPNVKIFGDLDMELEKIAVCPGSGKHMAGHALARGCQVLVTGDIDHHEGIDANMQGLAIIDAGHYGIEHIFCEFVAAQLKARFPELKVEREEKQQPFIVI